MKRIISMAAAALIALTAFAQFACAQNSKNNRADSIVGKYESVQNGDSYKVQITKNSDGTYKAQMYWTTDSIDPKTGKKYLDTKNPDKSLRNVPCDQIVLINGLKYNAQKKNWGGTKIYDPQRGIKANVTCVFEADGKLKLRGTVLGIGESAYWTPISSVQ